MTIRWPVIRFCARYARPRPYQLLPGLECESMISLGTLTVVIEQDFLHHFAHQPLLSGNFAGRVDGLQAEHSAQLVLNRQNTALETPEAFHRVNRMRHIHSSFMILELRAASQKPFQRDFNWHLEIERQIGTERKAVDLANPFRMHTTRNVARECGVDVTIGE